MNDISILVIFVCVTFILYFIPALVASRRKHANYLSIAVLNFFTGWTFIGWVASLVWACSKDRER